MQSNRVPQNIYKKFNSQETLILNLLKLILKEMRSKSDDFVEVSP